MSRKYKLSSSIGRNVCLLLCLGVVIYSFAYYSAHHDKYSPIYMGLGAIGVLLFFLSPTVVATKDKIIVSRLVGDARVYPMYIISRIKKSWSGLGKVELYNRKGIYFLPKPLDMLLHFFSYGEYVMKKIKSLEDK